MAGHSAFGTALYIGNGLDPQGFTKLAGLLTLGGPTQARDTIETTDHDSAESFREFIAGLGDGGEISLDLNYLPADPTQGAPGGLLGLLRSGALRDFRIVWPTGRTITLSGIVTGFDPTGAYDGKLEASATIKVSGAPVIEAAPFAAAGGDLRFGTLAQGLAVSEANINNNANTSALTPAQGSQIIADVQVPTWAGNRMPLIAARHADYEIVAVSTAQVGYELTINPNLVGVYAYATRAAIAAPAGGDGVLYQITLRRI